MALAHLPEEPKMFDPDDDDFDRDVLMLASERNPDLAFSTGEDTGYDRDYPRAEDY